VPKGKPTCPETHPSRQKLSQSLKTSGQSLSPGPIPGDVDVKSVRARRDRRWMELKLKHGAAVLQNMTHKIWRTAGGSKERPSHKAANGQKVGINDHFRVGGHKMFLPSDPSAPWSETATCRCDVEYVQERSPLLRSTVDDILNATATTNYPIRGQIEPVRSNLGGTHRYDFIADRKIRIITHTANAIPTQMSGFRLRAFWWPLRKDGKDGAVLYDPNHPEIIQGGHVRTFSPETRYFDAGFNNPYGFHWQLTAEPAVASDNQGPVFFVVERNGD